MWGNESNVEGGKAIAAALPIFIVDDMVDSTRAWIENLEIQHPGREFAAFNTLAAARRALVSLDFPFGLILDHNMDGEQERHGQIFGASLAPQIRSNNPWGLALPIAYYSAWCTAGKFATEVAQQYASLGPTLFFDKNETPNIADVVAALDEQFRRTGPVFLSAMMSIQARGYDFEVLADMFGTSSADAS